MKSWKIIYLDTKNIQREITIHEAEGFTKEEIYIGFDSSDIEIVSIKEIS